MSFQHGEGMLQRHKAEFVLTPDAERDAKGASILATRKCGERVLPGGRDTNSDTAGVLLLLVEFVILQLRS
jgi:hypothetical protein